MTLRTGARAIGLFRLSEDPDYVASAKLGTNFDHLAVIPPTGTVNPFYSRPRSRHSNTVPRSSAYAKNGYSTRLAPSSAAANKHSLLRLKAAP